MSGLGLPQLGLPQIEFCLIKQDIELTLDQI